MSALRVALEGLVNRWAVGGNGIDAASQDLISACSAELLRVLDQHPAGDDAAGSEAPAAKVIIVRDEAGREHRYSAPNFGMLHDGTLVIGDKTTGEDLRVDAARAPGRWSAVCKDGVLSPDSTATALRIARDALGEISRFVLEADDPRTIVVRIARDALDDVFAETEL